MAEKSVIIKIPLPGNITRLISIRERKAGSDDSLVRIQDYCGWGILRVEDREYTYILDGPMNFGRWLVYGLCVDELSALIDRLIEDRTILA